MKPINTVRDFLEEYTRENPAGERKLIPCYALYHHYQKWCDDYGIQYKIRNNFEKEITRLGANRERKKEKNNGMLYYWNLNEIILFITGEYKKEIIEKKPQKILNMCSEIKTKSDFSPQFRQIVGNKNTEYHKFPIFTGLSQETMKGIREWMNVSSDKIEEFLSEQKFEIEKHFIRETKMISFEILLPIYEKWSKEKNIKSIGNIILVDLMKRMGATVEPKYGVYFDLKNLSPFQDGKKEQPAINIKYTEQVFSFLKESITEIEHKISKDNEDNIIDACLLECIYKKWCNRKGIMPMDFVNFDTEITIRGISSGICKDTENNDVYIYNFPGSMLDELRGDKKDDEPKEKTDAYINSRGYLVVSFLKDCVHDIAKNFVEKHHQRYMIEGNKLYGMYVNWTTDNGKGTPLPTAEFFAELGSQGILAHVEKDEDGNNFCGSIFPPLVLTALGLEESEEYYLILWMEDQIYSYLIPHKIILAEEWAILKACHGNFLLTEKGTETEHYINRLNNIITLEWHKYLVDGKNTLTETKILGTIVSGVTGRM